VAALRALQVAHDLGEVLQRVVEVVRLEDRELQVLATLSGAMPLRPPARPEVIAYVEPRP
jgi:hypothetical protein